MHKEIAARVQRAIEKQVFPGCAVGIVRRNGEREIFPFGHFTYETSSEVAKNTIYDVASITKSIPTASLALTLLSEGKMKLDDTVRTYLPELQHDHGATIEDLLTYRVHGTPLSLLKDRTPDDILSHLFSHGFEAPPSDVSKYTNLPALFLGLIVERVARRPLHIIAEEEFFNPLGMTRTTFFPEIFSKDEIAPTEIEAWRGLVQGQAHDESAYVFAVHGKRAVGHAGLFSTISDLLNFMEALLSDGEGPMSAIRVGAEKGWGWQTSGGFLGHGGKRFGKTGFTGTSIVCDVERGIAFAILSNRTYPKRPPNDSAIAAFRADIADLILRSSV